MWRKKAFGERWNSSTCRNIFSCPAAKEHVTRTGPWYYNPLLFFGLHWFIFHTAFRTLRAQEHVCLFCYSKPESEKKRNSFIELPAMALIEKCNTPRWVIGPIVTHEICAIGDRLRVYLSVRRTFVQLLQCPEPGVCRSSTFPVHGWYRLPLIASFLQPAEHQKNSVWHSFNLHLYGFFFFFLMM